VELSRQRAVVFFEAPHRVRKTLEELVNLVKSPIVSARELTKIHEELRFGLPAELLEAFQAPQGEFTFVVPPSSVHDDDGIVIGDDQIVAVFGQLAEKSPSGSKRDVARAAAERLGLTTKQVYEAMERHKLGQ
jgi:16S rRNA C1402 (ribose-2'-O) methylase RsmI